MRPLLSPATLPKKIPGRDDFLAVGKRHLARFRDRARRRRRHRPAALLLRNAGKEGGISPEIALRPLVEGMVVALGTLDLNSQERPGRAGGEFFRLQFERRIKQGRSRIARLARGQKQLASHLGVRAVLGEAVAEPVLEPVAGAGVVGRRRVGQQDLPPDVGQMARVAGTRQKRVDQACPFVGRRIVEERPGFADPWNPPGQIEVSPPQKLRIGRARSRLDDGVFPGGRQQGVDARSHLRIDVGGVLARTVGRAAKKGRRRAARGSRPTERTSAPRLAFFRRSSREHTLFSPTRPLKLNTCDRSVAGPGLRVPPLPVLCSHSPSGAVPERRFRSCSSRRKSARNSVRLPGGIGGGACFPDLGERRPPGESRACSNGPRSPRAAHGSSTFGPSARPQGVSSRLSTSRACPWHAAPMPIP